MPPVPALLWFLPLAGAWGGGLPQRGLCTYNNERPDMGIGGIPPAQKRIMKECRNVLEKPAGEQENSRYHRSAAVHHPFHVRHVHVQLA